MPADSLNIGGFTPLSTIDYPDRLAAVVFCQGCPWRCRYCHNPDLLEPAAVNELQWPEVAAFLHQRRRLLDAVVFSGGEPCAQSSLPDALRNVRQLGFEIGLHTAGAYPKRLAGLLPLLDWVGLDIKALPDDYPLITGIPDSGKRAWESLHVLSDSGLRHEIRITVHPDLLPPQRLHTLLTELRKTAIGDIVLQTCRPEGMLDANLRKVSADYLQSLNPAWAHIAVRGADTATIARSENRAAREESVC